MIVGTACSEMPNGGLTLNFNIVGVIGNFKSRFIGITHLPNDHGGNLNGITHLVVYLQRSPFQVLRTQGNPVGTKKRIDPQEPVGFYCADILPKKSESKRV